MLTANNLSGFNARVAFGVAQSGTLFACGSNEFGQLGLGETVLESRVLTQVGTDTDWRSVSCGGDFTIAIKTDNTMWATGHNEVNQLGLGDGIDRFEFTRIGLDSDWATVSAGGQTVLAIKTSGFMYGWGINNNGQLGLGDINNRTTPVQIGGASSWTQAFCGNVHSAALQTNTLLLTGNNNLGQLGDGTKNQKMNFGQPSGGGSWSKAALGDSHTIGLKTNGTVETVGNNNNGQLGLASTGGDHVTFAQEILGLVTFIDVACNTQTSHAITSAVDPSDQLAYGCGNNSNGQIGDGTIDPRSTFTQIDNKGWGGISGNVRGESFILLKEQDMWGTGFNDDGQLGLADIQERVSPDNSPSSNDFSQISAGKTHSFALVA